MRSQEEIQTVVQALQELKPIIRRKAFFGDDNWEKIDAQIYVLQEDIDEDEIFDRYTKDDDLDIRDAAFDAYAWKTGDDEIDLILDWQSLVVNKGESHA